MGMLEDILTKAAGKVLGVDEDKAKAISVVLPILIAVLSGGGLKKILEKMREMGLGDQAASWVGTGESQGISGDQAAELIGESHVKEIAEKAGVDEAKAAELVAEVLPQAVDQLSPDGAEPDADKVDEQIK